MLLTERQKFILRDLLKEQEKITAKALSERYNVSLRTVRYDLENVEYWLKEKGAALLKVPRIGMTVENRKVALEAMKSMNFDTNEVLYSAKDRQNMILFKLIIAGNPITSEELAQKFYVSRSTIITTIKEISRELEKHFINVKGKTKHGFFLTGDEENIRRYIRKIFVPFTMNTYTENFAFLIGSLFQAEEINVSNEIVLLLKKHTNIKFDSMTSQVIKFRILLWFRRIRSGNILHESQQKISKYRNIKVYAEFKSIYKILVDKYNIAYEENEIAYFLYMILSESVDPNFINQLNFNDKRLQIVIDKMVSISCNELNIKDSEASVLSKELFTHLKTTLNKLELNVIDNNPILEPIKAKYGDVFAVIKKSSMFFKEEYGFDLSEDEIGFITMYFLKSLEKDKIYKKKNVVVVCNTSRGTSKLLAIRIKNNIPEVNVKRIASIIDIENNENLLKDVDLVISTVKIKELHKPTIIVSPIITTYELTKIRDFLYIKKDYSEIKKDEKSYIDDTLVTIIQKYAKKEDVHKLHKEITNLIGSYLNNFSNENKKDANYSQAELTGLILIEISDMILKLYPNNIDGQDFKKIFGIIIHIIMAIPRWQNGEYNSEKSIRAYERKYPKEFKIIEETFNKISKKYKILIRRTEIVSILRYLI